MGKRDFSERSYEQVTAEVFESIETTRKRLKVYEEQTAQIVLQKGDDKFRQLMEQYMKQQNEGEPVIRDDIEGTVSEAESKPEREQQSEEVEEEKSQQISNYPESEDEKQQVNEGMIQPDAM